MDTYSTIICDTNTVFSSNEIDFILPVPDITNIYEINRNNSSAKQGIIITLNQDIETSEISEIIKKLD